MVAQRTCCFLFLFFLSPGLHHISLPLYPSRRITGNKDPKQLIGSDGIWWKIERNPFFSILTVTVWTIGLTFSVTISIIDCILDRKERHLNYRSRRGGRNELPSSSEPVSRPFSRVVREKKKRILRYQYLMGHWSLSSSHHCLSAFCAQCLHVDAYKISISTSAIVSLPHCHRRLGSLFRYAFLLCKQVNPPREGRKKGKKRIKRMERKDFPLPPIHILHDRYFAEIRPLVTLRAYKLPSHAEQKMAISKYNPHQQKKEKKKENRTTTESVTLHHSLGTSEPHSGHGSMREISIAHTAREIRRDPPLRRPESTLIQASPFSAAGQA